MTNNFSLAAIWLLRLIAAIIMLQTLLFKFSGADESIYIFTKLGLEPWGRIGTGIIELIASVLILYPRTTAFGAALGMGVMAGAIFYHITKLGIEVQNDSGQLFIYAILVFVSCTLLFLTYRKQIIRLLPHY
jgi:uncharacterized membrane protein YphA (DoxX/SURF4 family)